MDRPTALNARRMLVESLALLAAPVGAQRAWLAQTHTEPSADELGLQFDDWFQLLPQVLAEGVITPDDERAVTAVSQALDAIAPGDWTSRALSGKAWANVRMLAGMALVMLVGGPVESRKLPAEARA